MFSGNVWVIAKKTLYWFRIFVFFITIVFVIAWAIPSVRTILDSSGFFDEKTVLAIVGLGLLLTVMGLVELQASFEKLNNRIDSIMPRDSSCFIEGGGSEVGVMIGPLMSDMKRRATRKVDLLGMTLDTGWAHIKDWVESDGFESIVINVHSISPKFAAANSHLINASTVKSAELYSNLAASYIDLHEEDLKSKEIELNIFLYDNLPPIHGILLGNGGLFIANADWGLPPGPSSKQPCFEFFSLSDKSPRALANRSLFDSWLKELKK